MQNLKVEDLNEIYIREKLLIIIYKYNVDYITDIRLHVANIFVAILRSFK